MAQRDMKKRPVLQIALYDMLVSFNVPICGIVSADGSLLVSTSISSEGAGDAAALSPASHGHRSIVRGCPGMMTW